MIVWLILKYKVELTIIAAILMALGCIWVDWIHYIQEDYLKNLLPYDGFYLKNIVILVARIIIYILHIIGYLLCVYTYYCFLYAVKDNYLNLIFMVVGLYIALIALRATQRNKGKIKAGKIVNDIIHD